MSHRDVIRRTTAVGALVGTLLVGGCSDEKTPVRLGLISGISGSNADFGQAGRNGAMLAIEDANLAGGINGHPIELIIRDDRNSRDVALSIAAELVKERVAAIIGPFTSTMSETVRAVTEPAKMLVFSPTGSTVRLSGLDDHFFRLCPTSAADGERDAEFMVKRRGYKRIALAGDSGNSAFTRTLAEAFSAKFRALGGEIVVETWHDFRSLVGFADLVEQLREPKPDAVFIVANAVDVARVVQQFRKVDTTTKIVGTHWAATQQLIELGGKAVEGTELPQLFDGFGMGKRYLHFAGSYRLRFNEEPSSSAVLAYEVALVLIEAIKRQRDGQSLKDAILANRPYEGLQRPLEIDAYGDSRREPHFVVIKNAAFSPAP